MRPLYCISEISRITLRNKLELNPHIVSHLRISLSERVPVFGTRELNKSSCAAACCEILDNAELALNGDFN